MILTSTKSELFILIWCGMGNCLVSVLAQTCFDLNLLSNTSTTTGLELKTQPFRLYQSRGLMDCYRQCGRHTLCQSVNFNTTTSECQLNQASSGAMVVNTGSVFMRIEPSTLEILTSCKNHGCPNNSMCVVEGSSYRCVPVGCSGVPDTNHVNRSSFLAKSLWDFNDIAPFPCEAGYFPDTDAVCLTNGAWTHILCLPLRNCKKVFSCGSSYDEGEYWLYTSALSTWVKVFCTRSNDRTFITLHNLNTASTPSVLKNPSTCSTAEADPSMYPEMGSTEHYKARIFLWIAYLQTGNFVFSKSNYSRQRFGSAGDCYSENTTAVCPAIGHFVINTNGTGLRVNASTNWISMDKGGRVDNITRSADGLVIEGYCGADQGVCGGCEPESGRIQLELDPNYTPPDESATWVLCQYSPPPE